MGSKSGDASEYPVRTVRIRRPFAIGKYEVTIGQWRDCVAMGGCKYNPKLRGTGSATPMHKLSWVDAIAYLEWLSKLTGYRYRLPSEAEWEFAARGGTVSQYWWGNEMTAGMADCKDCGSKWNYRVPANAGSDKANPFGLHGMSGGVWEWTADCWHKSFAGAPRDGGAWVVRHCRRRVLRGGGWRNDASYARSAARFRYDYNVRYTTNGFRVVRELD
jgi:formylglycine-generating enzyme required for sulfatase activity